MLLKEKYTYHANFDLTSDTFQKDGEINWVSVWKLASEKIQFAPGLYFSLVNVDDWKIVFKDLSKNVGYGSRSKEYRAFKQIVESHDLKLENSSYAWQMIDGMLMLFIANIEFDKQLARSRVNGKSARDDKWFYATGNLIVIRYEEAEKQYQAILYRELVERKKTNINRKYPTMSHVCNQLENVETRGRAIKAKSLRDVVDVVNHNAEVLNTTVDRLDTHAEVLVEVADAVNDAADRIELHNDKFDMLMKMLAEQQAMMALQQAELAALKANAR